MGVGMEASDSYYSGCRKANNCFCEKCIESINATLDIMPHQRTSLFTKNLTPTSKLSKLCPSLASPDARNRLVFQPPSEISEQIFSQAASSGPTTTSEEAIADQIEDVTRKKKKRVFPEIVLACKRILIAATSIFLVVSLGPLCLSQESLRTVFSPKLVHRVAVEASHFDNVKKQMSFVQNRLKEIGFGKINNCNAADSYWEIKKDGFLIHSKCVLYKSMVEEVSIWGWPLQTEGLLVTGFSQRSITVLSGQLVEFVRGTSDLSVHKRNCSWTERELSAKPVQLDPMTWLLEHQGLAIGRDLRFFQVVMKFCKISVHRLLENMKNTLLVHLQIQDPHSIYMQQTYYKHPT